MKTKPLNVLLGCEESQEVCKAFRKKGHNAFSCDLLDCSGGHPEWHLKMDIFEAIKLKQWHIGIFFPDCTYLTCSAEWAYKPGPYHQKVKPGTLTGKERLAARAKAREFFISLWDSGIEKIALENPVGIMSRWKKPNQIIQPYQFGDNASKATCLWLRNLPILQPTTRIPPRLVNGKKRWANQTDSGQNKLPPSTDRSKLRSKTYSGIAQAMADQWG